MKLSGFKDDYKFFSGKASDVARQLSFAGIGLIWLFRMSDGGDVALPSELILPAIFLVITLTADLLHYVSGTIIWGSFHRFHERRINDVREDPEIPAPAYLNWPGNTFFVTKLAGVLIAYAFLFKYLYDVLIVSQGSASLH